MGNKNSSGGNEFAEINNSLNNVQNLSLPQLENLNDQIGGVIGRGSIRKECIYDNYKEKYEITTRNGVEISRRYINSTYVGKSSKIESVPLSSANSADLKTAQGIVQMFIQEKKKLYSSIKTLQSIGNNPNNETSIDEALKLATNFLGMLEKDGKLSNRSGSFLRLVSFDGKRQVRWDIEPSPNHCKGRPHFNFEILEEGHQEELSKILGFKVSNNYHLFLKKN